MPDSWIEVGVIEEADASGEGVTVLFAPGLMGEDGEARAEVPASRLRLIPDEDDAGAYFVLFDSEGTPLQGELEDAEKDRLAAAASADDEIGEQSENMTDSPIAEGTDGVDDEGRPVDGGASVDELDEMRAVPVPGLVPEARASAARGHPLADVDPGRRGPGRPTSRCARWTSPTPTPRRSRTPPTWCRPAMGRCPGSAPRLS